MPVQGFPADWELSPLLPEVPVGTTDEILALFPKWVQDDQQGDSPSPVLAAIVKATLKAFVQYASSLAEWAGDANPDNAVGSMLDLLGAQRGFARGLGQADDSYRDHTLNDDAVVSPTAIMEAINAIVATYSTSTPYYMEYPDDGVWVYNDGTASDGFYNTSDYPILNTSRQYELRPQSTPRKAFLFADGRTGHGLVNNYGTCFIGVPALPLGDQDQTCYVSSSSTGGTWGYDVGVASADTGEFVYADGIAATQILSNVRALLTARGMWPVQFTLVLDPDLV